MFYLQIILYITKVNWCIAEVTCLPPCLFDTSGYEMSPDEGQEEYEEVQADLKKREEEVSIYFQRNQLNQLEVFCIPWFLCCGFFINIFCLKSD